ncbi:GFA family protein [Yoonia sp. 208BN28-4]|uniref:GFA family protein n=1 Tax=Yoonia sp. 208BN28-4 TaxID=3126505 RepID=UPI0030A346BB
MLEGACHCGAVKVRYDGLPKAAVRCNCSICRRLGVTWGHGPLGVITIIANPDATRAYLCGDRSLAFHHCRTCGCTTHWLSQEGGDSRNAAINLNLVESPQWADIPVRQFDGADTWRFTD